MKGKPVGFKMRNKELARKKIVKIEIIVIVNLFMVIIRNT